LKKLILNGAEVHPGANIVFSLTQKAIDEVESGSNQSTGHPLHIMGKNLRKKVANELKFGDIVERHLEDGDCVLFNR
jgi:DNA-directed RNA polymerase III subunit RPC1